MYLWHCYLSTVQYRCYYSRTPQLFLLWKLLAAVYSTFFFKYTTYTTVFPQLSTKYTMTFVCLVLEFLLPSPLLVYFFFHSFSINDRLAILHLLYSIYWFVPICLCVCGPPSMSICYTTCILVHLVLFWLIFIVGRGMWKVLSKYNITATKCEPWIHKELIIC